MPLAISAFISPNRRSSPNGLLGTVQEFRGGEKITNHSQILFSGWFCVLHLQEMYNLVWLWTTAKSRAVRSTEVNGNPMRLNINLTPYSCLLNLPWIIKLTWRMICVNYSPYLVWPSMVQCCHAWQNIILLLTCMTHNEKGTSDCTIRNLSSAFGFFSIHILEVIFLCLCFLKNEHKWCRCINWI